MIGKVFWAIVTVQLLEDTEASTGVLIVEDEPMIAADLAQIFENHGAHVYVANSLRAALEAVEADGLSAAILDHRLGRHDSERLYVRLQARGIPSLFTADIRP
jgi:DNA-binding response OmpR family regulator